MAALAHSSVNEWWMEARLAQEALRVARDRLDRAVGGPSLDALDHRVPAEIQPGSEPSAPQPEPN
eukprot:7985963-Pyramimonas_sp.AAC.1